MKKPAFFLAALGCSGALLLGSCNRNQSTPTTAPGSSATTTTPAADSAGKPNGSTEARYECPMDDGGQSSQPGKCPKCGMDLVKKG